MRETVKVLFVDDEPDIRTIVEISLGLDPGIDLRSIASGSEAIALVDSGGFAPDVILIDMRMPEMNGLELMTHLRRRAVTSETPVVFMTASARPADIDSYREAGARDVIIKAFDPITLPAKIRSYCD